MTTGSRVKQMRIELQLTQDELASKVGLARNSLSSIENDKRLPSMLILNKLSSVLGVTTDYLMCQSDFKYVKTAEEEHKRINDLVYKILVGNGVISENEVLSEEKLQEIRNDLEKVIKMYKAMKE